MFVFPFLCSAMEDDDDLWLKLTAKGKQKNHLWFSFLFFLSKSIQHNNGKQIDKQQTRKQASGIARYKHSYFSRKSNCRCFLIERKRACHHSLCFVLKSLLEDSDRWLAVWFSLEISVVVEARRFNLKGEWDETWANTIAPLNARWLRHKNLALILRKAMVWTENIHLRCLFHSSC